MEKKHLDDFFKEKLNDYAEMPEEQLWERISDSLEKKKKRRIIPIWWQLGGAAAAIALLFMLVNPFNEESPSITPSVVETESNEAERNNGSITEDDPITSPDNTTEIVNSTIDNDDNGSNKKVLSNNNSTSIQIANTSEKSNSVSTVIGNDNIAKSDDTANGETSDNLSQTLASNKSSDKKKTNGMVIGQTPSKEGINTISDKTQNAIATNDPITNETTSPPIGEKSEPLYTEKAIAASDEVKKDSLENGKKSIFEAIKEQEALEDEALAENKSGKKWSMGPAVAPVFFSTLGEGSPIHSNFASNSKSGKLNLSYGLMVSYNVSEKLSIRSGVHKVDYGYDTNDIVFTSSLTTSTAQLIDNITYAQTSRNLVVENAPRTSSDAVADVAGQLQPFEGRMVQQLGYVEVPMELNYALIDNKFGVNLIGGVSSLFLVDNAVTLESEELITEMGEANNANSVNFSTNIGIGFRYGISDNIQLNVEPIFKYQLNTFSDTAGNFRPYSVGVYSGLNFRF